MASATGVIGSKGSFAGSGLGSCGVSRSQNGMYLVPATGLSLKVTVLSDGASEMKSTAVSCSELSGGPERTEISGLFALFPLLLLKGPGFHSKLHSAVEISLKCEESQARGASHVTWFFSGICQCLQTLPSNICSPCQSL